MMYVSRRHVSMMYVSMMHVSMMLVSIMHIHDAYIPEACFQDSHIHVSMKRGRRAREEKNLTVQHIEIWTLSVRREQCLVKTQSSHNETEKQKN